jgi:hypothetical protein
MSSERSYNFNITQMSSERYQTTNPAFSTINVFRPIIFLYLDVLRAVTGHLRGICAKKFVVISRISNNFYLLFCLPRKIDENALFALLRGIFLLFICPGKIKKKLCFCEFLWGKFYRFLLHFIAFNFNKTVRPTCGFHQNQNCRQYIHENFSTKITKNHVEFNAERTEVCLKFYYLPIYMVKLILNH